MSKTVAADLIDPRRMATVSARVTWQTKAALKRLSKSEGKPVSDLLHQLIMTHLEGKGGLPK